MQQDGDNKNDCERNAAKRFLSHLRREHPPFPVQRLMPSMVILAVIVSNA